MDGLHVITCNYGNHTIVFDFNNQNGEGTEVGTITNDGNS